MLSCRLSDVNTAEQLVVICRQFQEDIDVIHGRYVIDGKSTLGVVSLIGNIVSLEINTSNEQIKKEFEKEIIKLNESVGD